MDTLIFAEKVKALYAGAPHQLAIKDMGELENLYDYVAIRPFEQKQELIRFLYYFLTNLQKDSTPRYLSDLLLTLCPMKDPLLIKINQDYYASFSKHELVVIVKYINLFLNQYPQALDQKTKQKIKSHWQQLKNNAK